MIITSERNGAINITCINYKCDFVEEIERIPKEKRHMGDTIYVIHGARVFMTDSELEWVEQ